MQPQIQLSKSRLQKNLQAIQGWAGDAKLFPVLKANAYGHGAAEVARFLEEQSTEDDIPFFCLARLSEARELRENGVIRPLLILSHFDQKDLEGSPLSDVELVVGDWADFELLKTPKASWVRGLHVNINTGMNRLGFDCLTTPIGSLLAKLKTIRIPVTGIMSHLAAADEESSFSQEQFSRFGQTLTAMHDLWATADLGPWPQWIHLENSAGISRGVADHRVTAARPGLSLYGIPPFSGVRDLKPVMRVVAPVRQILRLAPGATVGYGQAYQFKRDALVGTIALGYADGVSRSLSRVNHQVAKASFRILDWNAPIVGRVSMDMTAVDLSQHPQRARLEELAKSGQQLELEAEWIGDHQSADDVAKVLGTISYEVCCALSARLKRYWVE